MKKSIEEQEKQETFSVGNLKITSAKLIEHVPRHNSLFSKIIEGAVEEKSNRWRPSEECIRQIV
jgi:hypothetical protein